MNNSESEKYSKSSSRRNMLACFRPFGSTPTEMKDDVGCDGHHD
jgi:hypothetical protein